MSAIKVMNVSRNASHVRRINKSSSASVNGLPTPETLGRNEIDSLADTSCVGKNWIPLLFTGDMVNVFGYSGVQHDSAIPLATCATKIVSESGSAYILICPQMLWFGTKLPRSLINPNQLRMSGTLVKDDPTTDGDQEFGLITDNLFIPFQTAGSTIYFKSITPSCTEVEEL